VPAIVLRELLVRLGGLRWGMLLSVLVIACCLAVSAKYKLIEFGAAMALGQGADEFLGTQGDPWDTQLGHADVPRRRGDRAAGTDRHPQPSARRAAALKGAVFLALQRIFA
jgi:hypothetical protein